MMVLYVCVLLYLVVRGMDWPNRLSRVVVVAHVTELETRLSVICCLFDLYFSDARCVDLGIVDYYCIQWLKILDQASILC